MQNINQNNQNKVSYKNCETRLIGDSDIATLILSGCDKNNKLKLSQLHFGKDASYKAYIVDEHAEIGNHYIKVDTFTQWLRIYDDYGLTYRVEASEINIYRAGEMGCIIQLIA